MNKIFKLFYKFFPWIIISLIFTFSFYLIAIARGERVSALWLIVCCTCAYLIAYRFYSKWIAFKILHCDGRNATAATKINDGKDFVPTNKWIVFGHHFAAIAGPGPLIGPTLAAQFGYLPGVLWILIGSVLAGAVQDMIILFASMRRDAKSLGQMIKEEIGPLPGFAALIGTLSIIIILISVLGLIVVKALMHSPWGSFTVLMTIPIAMFIGIYLSYIRIGKVFEASIIGISLFLISIYFGKIINYSPEISYIFDKDAIFIAYCIIFYGFLAATLPVWLLLAPRDYLSSFLKLGTIILIIVAILIFQPDLKMPAFTSFIDGNGPIFSGKIFPFLFITIACGAISGFHALVASGTTPKLISDERDVRLIGYGSMLLEGIVAICAIIAASIIEPGIFFAINSPSSVIGNTASEAVNVINSWGYDLNENQINALSDEMGESSLLSRTGGAPSLAVGIAHILSSAFSKNMLAMWYHFAIMFEAIFILTTLDAGTRVARFMLQDLLKNFKLFKKFNHNFPNIFSIISSFIIVVSWGYFLYIGVIDANGGVNILWPLFGMSNQMLAGIALCLACIILVKNGNKKYLFITLIPLLFISLTTTIAVLEKVFSKNLKVGFLAVARNLENLVSQGLVTDLEIAEKMIFNQKLLSVIAIFFLIIFWTVLISTLTKIAKKIS